MSSSGIYPPSSPEGSRENSPPTNPEVSSPDCGAPYCPSCPQADLVLSQASAMDITLGGVEESVGDEVRMLIASGEATGEDIPLKGTAVNVVFRENVEELLELIVYQGFPHHFVMSYGDIAGELRELCALLGIRVVSVQKR